MNHGRTGTLLALCAAAALLAAGCADADGRTGQSPGQTTGQSKEAGGAVATRSSPARQHTSSEPPVAGESAPGRTTTRPPWCRTSDFAVGLHQLNPAAGNRYTALVLTNTSAHSCRTRGWPGLQLTGKGGRDIPTTVVRDRSRAPAPLTVAVRASVWSRLHWSPVPGQGDRSSGPCQPVPSALQVIPPDQRAHTVVRWDAGEVCGGGRFETQPLAAGKGPAY
jgi:Protein of unknown function (DUF4232)